MVDYKGNISKAVASPLCEEWRKYFVEDDFRLHNHEPLEDMGCFCQLHMQKYSEALGKKVTREQFVQGLVDNTDGYRKAYLSVNRDTMESAMGVFVVCVKTILDFIGVV